MIQLLFTKQAATDLKNIGRFTQRQWGKKARIEYLCRLQCAFSRLVANPGLGSVRKELSDSFRILPVARHLVVYRIDDENHVVIVRVLHQSMDFMNASL